jgi:hypothetical protein
METAHPNQAYDQFSKALIGFLELGQARPTNRTVAGIAESTLGFSSATAQMGVTGAPDNLKAAISLVEFVGLSGEGKALLPNAQIRLGEMELGSHNFEDAERLFQKALAEVKGGGSSGSLEVVRLEMACLNNLGVLYDKTERPRLAENAFRESLPLADTLWKRSPEAYGDDVVTTVSNIAKFYHAHNRESDSSQLLSQLIQNLKTMASQDPAVFEPRLAECLVRLATIYQNESVADTVGYLETALPIFEKLDSSSDAHLRELFVETLTLLANAYRNTKPPAAAESMLVRAREEASHLPAGDDSYISLQATASANLGLFYVQQGDAKKAENPIMAAYALFRDLQKKNPEGFGDNFAQAALLLAYVRRDNLGAADCKLLKEAELAAISSSLKQEIVARGTNCQQ